MVMSLLGYSGMVARVLLLSIIDCRSCPDVLLMFSVHLCFLVLFFVSFVLYYDFTLPLPVNIPHHYKTKVL